MTTIATRTISSSLIRSSSSLSSLLRDTPGYAQDPMQIGDSCGCARQYGQGRHLSIAGPRCTSEPPELLRMPPMTGNADTRQTITECRFHGQRFKRFFQRIERRTGPDRTCWPLSSKCSLSSRWVLISQYRDRSRCRSAWSASVRPVLAACIQNNFVGDNAGVEHARHSSSNEPGKATAERVALTGTETLR